MNTRESDGRSPPGGWTIMSVLEWTKGWFKKKGFDNPRLDAELIVAHALKLPRVMLYARFDQPLNDQELLEIRGLVKRRGAHEPMAYILGSREFYSLELEVTPDVLIPRPDTETLVEVALERLKNLESPSIVDVGTGSGAVALALAQERPTAKITAVDVSVAALEVARRNAEKLQLQDRVSFVRSDLLASVAHLEPDLVVANLPYIPTRDIATLMPDVRNFEPKLALDGGIDGLALIRKLIEQIPMRSAIALEADPAQFDSIRNSLENKGFSGISTRKDLAGLDRVISAPPRST